MDPKGKVECCCMGKNERKGMRKSPSLGQSKERKRIRMDGNSRAGEQWSQKASIKILKPIL